MHDVRTDDLNEAGQPSIDPARQAAARELAQNATGGGLTLDEYAERAAALEQAATPAELEAVLAEAPPETAPVSAARRGRWIVAVFGGTEQRGRWRLSRHLRVVAVFGGATLDLGAAQPEAPESLITVVAILGGADILAPRGLSVQLSGVSVLGGKGDKRAGGPPLAGSPLIRVRAFTLLGGVALKDNAPRGKLLDVIRARWQKPAAS